MLMLVWLSSVALASIALAVMVALVVVRVITDLVRKKQELRRNEILGRLLAWLEGAVPDDAMKRQLLANRALGTSLLIEIFELMRGRDQERLARLADETNLPQYLRERIEVGTTRERLNAAERLVWFPSDETRAILRFALRDRNPNVGLAAAASLSELGEHLPIRQLLESRLDHGGESSRQLEAVLVRVAPRQVDDLLGLARDETAPERVRAAALDALARTGSFELIAPIASLAPSPSNVIRAAVARDMGVFGHPQGEAVVLQLLDDADWEVRAEAAEAAGRIGLQSAVERLCALLTDENWWVRFRSGVALTNLGAAGTDTLRRIAGAGTNRAARMAELVLAERGLL